LQQRMTLNQPENLPNFLNCATVRLAVLLMVLSH
jgi:hypothetical protein